MCRRGRGSPQKRESDGHIQCQYCCDALKHGECCIIVKIYITTKVHKIDLNPSASNNVVMAMEYNGKARELKLTNKVVSPFSYLIVNSARPPSPLPPHIKRKVPYCIVC